MCRLSCVQASVGRWGRYRRGVRFLASILLVLLFVPAWTGEGRLPLFDRPVQIEASPLPLQALPRRFGRLTLVGAMRLEGDSPAFGGFSALSVRGGRVTMLSDGGNWASFAIRRGNPVAVEAGALPYGPGTGWLKRDRDSESLAVDPATGRIWIGFERANAIWRYAPGFARAEAQVRPPEMRGWPDNAGPETLVRLRDGGFVIVAERGKKRRYARPGLLFARDPVANVGEKPLKFTFRPPPGYDPSDAVELPNGDLLVLVRRFALPFRFSAKLVILPRRAIRAGKEIAGREIATLADGVFAENWEGVALTREQGHTMVWLVSDRDTALLQHTVLAKFRLD